MSVSPVSRDPSIFLLGSWAVKKISDLLSVNSHIANSIESINSNEMVVIRDEGSTDVKADENLAPETLPIDNSFEAATGLSVWQPDPT